MIKKLFIIYAISFQAFATSSVVDVSVAALQQNAVLKCVSSKSNLKLYLIGERTDKQLTAYLVKGTTAFIETCRDATHGFKNKDDRRDETTYFDNSSGGHGKTIVTCGYNENSFWRADESPIKFYKSHITGKMFAIAKYTHPDNRYSPFGKMLLDFDCRER